MPLQSKIYLSENPELGGSSEVLFESRILNEVAGREISLCKMSNSENPSGLRSAQHNVGSLVLYTFSRAS